MQNVAGADALPSAAVRSLYEVLLSYGPCRKVANSILTTCHTPPPAGHLITLNIKHMPGNRTLGHGEGRDMAAADVAIIVGMSLL